MPPLVGPDKAGQRRHTQLPSLELEEDAVPDGPCAILISQDQKPSGREPGDSTTVASRSGHRPYDIRVKRSGWSAVLVWISSSSPLTV
jgi:hypothetical protein